VKFKLRPILSEIKELYHQPISEGRFAKYLKKLKGNSKGDLQLPIAGFNPMAKEHVLQKIEALERLNAEELINDTIQEFNAKLDSDGGEVYLVVINLADDLKGAWTNFYTTDFESKFKLNAFIERRFCVPYFWTSEGYSEDLIIARTTAYLNRTIYWLKNPKPKTLKDHLDQEIFVASNSFRELRNLDQQDIQAMDSFYHLHKHSQDHDIIFNFFYGNAASESLGYKQHGIENVTAYDYANFLAD